MRRVLLVDDSASTRALVRAIIEGEGFGESLDGTGFEVIEAASGFDAMRLLPRGTYDLVITDINMGDINGLELIQFIRKSDRHRETPLVIISTQSTERDVERGLALGANAFLAKPFTSEALRAVLVAQLTKAPAGARGTPENHG
jgi:two-component system chemotaxis response regulator CheY